MALSAVANDRSGLSIARRLFELLERGTDASVLRRVHAVRLPSKRFEYVFQIRHGKHQAARYIELAIIPIHQHAEIVEALGACVHHAFPHWPFLQFSIAHQAIRVEPGACFSRNGESLGYW